MKKMFQSIDSLSFDLIPWFNLNMSSYDSTFLQFKTSPDLRKKIGLEKIFQNKSFYFEEIIYKSKIGSFQKLQTFLKFKQYTFEPLQKEKWVHSFDPKRSQQSIRLDYDLMVEKKILYDIEFFYFELRKKLSKLDQNLHRSMQTKTLFFNHINTSSHSDLSNIEENKKLKNAQLTIDSFLNEYTLLQSNLKNLEKYLISKDVTQVWIFDLLQYYHKMISNLKNLEIILSSYEQNVLNFKKSLNTVYQKDASSQTRNLKQILQNRRKLLKNSKKCFQAFDELTSKISSKKEHHLLYMSFCTFLEIPYSSKSGSFWFYNKEKMFLSAVRKKIQKDQIFQWTGNANEITLKLPSLYKKNKYMILHLSLNQERQKIEIYPLKILRNDHSNLNLFQLHHSWIQEHFLSILNIFFKKKSTKLDLGVKKQFDKKNNVNIQVRKLPLKALWYVSQDYNHYEDRTKAYSDKQISFYFKNYKDALFFKNYWIRCLVLNKFEASLNEADLLFLHQIDYFYQEYQHFNLNNWNIFIWVEPSLLSLYSTFLAMLLKTTLENSFKIPTNFLFLSWSNLQFNSLTNNYIQFIKKNNFFLTTKKEIVLGKILQNKNILEETSFDFAKFLGINDNSFFSLKNAVFFGKKSSLLHLKDLIWYLNAFLKTRNNIKNLQIFKKDLYSLEMIYQEFLKEIDFHFFSEKNYNDTQNIKTLLKHKLHAMVLSNSIVHTHGLEMSTLYLSKKIYFKRSKIFQILNFVCFKFLELHKSNKTNASKQKMQFFEKKIINTSELLEPYIKNSIDCFLEIFYKQDSLNKYLITPNILKNPTNNSLFNLSNDLFYNLEYKINKPIQFFWKYYNFKHYEFIFNKFRNTYIFSPIVDWIDETNILSTYYYSKKITSRGEGGLKTHNATLSDRDIFPDYYGRICPILSPEGKHVGLVSTFSLFSKACFNNNIVTPFRLIKNGKILDQIRYLTSYEEFHKKLAPFDTPLNNQGRIISNYVYVRYQGKWILTYSTDVDGIDISSKQLFSLVTGLIPFLQHNDGARALMGSNMQKQSIPLKNPTAPIVQSGLEKIASNISNEGILSLSDGMIQQLEQDFFLIHHSKQFYYNHEKDSFHSKMHLFQSSNPSNYGIIPYSFYKIKRLKGSRNETIRQQKYSVTLYEKIRSGESLFKTSSTQNGELSLGQNLNIAFLSYEGYTFEDAVVFSEDVLLKGKWTSNHIEEYSLYFDCISSPSEYLLKVTPKELRDNNYAKYKNIRIDHLDQNGLPYVGATLGPSDILSSRIQVQKVNSQLKKLLLETPEKILLGHPDFKESVLKSIWSFVPDIRQGSYRGSVISLQIFSDFYYGFKTSLTNFQCARYKIRMQSYQIQKWLLSWINSLSKIFLFTSNKACNQNYLNLCPYVPWNLKIVYILHTSSQSLDVSFKKAVFFFHILQFFIKQNLNYIIPPIPRSIQFKDIKYANALTPSLVKIQIYSKYEAKEGDKISGRHGNKGIISKIISSEYMPYLADGRKIDVLLNPLGISSRMNLGQVYESHLSWSSSNIKKFIKKISQSENFSKVQNLRLQKSVISWIFRFQGQNKYINNLSATETKQIIRKLSDNLTIQSPSFHLKEFKEFRKWMYSSGLGSSGQVTLYDGLTGEPYSRKVTVGKMHMLKLYHLVKEKYHARNIGPYNLITQQPLRGRSRIGGQRLGEMEVWALQAYGAAFTLKEMMTFKADSIQGRENIPKLIHYGLLKKSIQNQVNIDIPASFDVMIKELMGMSILAKFIKVRQIKLRK